jgi:hypothetical protein
MPLRGASRIGEAPLSHVMSMEGLPKLIVTFHIARLYY